MPCEILVTGGGGLLGRALQKLCPQALFLTSRDGDLRDIRQTEALFEKFRPKKVLHLAAKIGGVKTNALHNADFFADNVQINVNVLQTAQKFGVSRLISILSSCALPNFPDRPSTEEDLHSGMPYGGNAGYSYAKRMLELQTRLLCEQYGVRFTTITPMTLYGPHDNWDLEEGHVAGALIHKCFLAKQAGKSFEVWGSGRAVRQFVYAPDIARLLLELLEKEDEEPETMIAAMDEGMTIAGLARKIADAMEFRGPVVFDAAKPEGELRRVLKSSRFQERFPHFHFTSFEEGLTETIQWFSDNQNQIHQPLGRIYDH